MGRRLSDEDTEGHRFANIGASYFLFGPWVGILTTSGVILLRYLGIETISEGMAFIIGWIGSVAYFTARYMLRKYF